MNTEIIIGIGALIISGLFLIITFYFNLRALKQSEENTLAQLKQSEENTLAQLKQSEENTLAQITYEGKKKALWNLKKIIDKCPTYPKLKQKLEEFPKTSDAILLPPDVLKEMWKEKSKLDKYYEENSPYPEPPEPSDEQIAKIQEEDYENYKKMPVEDRFEQDMMQEIDI
ncbi:MAG: hypothetical protein U9R34_06460, partial [Nanoarchaeota archaeon]|nr:hypothetical protein [Nanoarchaeota archaeon]